MFFLRSFVLRPSDFSKILFFLMWAIYFRREVSIVLCPKFKKRTDAEPAETLITVLKSEALVEEELQQKYVNWVKYLFFLEMWET